LDKKVFLSANWNLRGIRDRFFGYCEFVGLNVERDDEIAQGLVAGIWNEFRTEREDRVRLTTINHREPVLEWREEKANRFVETYDGS
jgi:hypothetical protein